MKFIMPWKCLLNCVRPETEDVHQLDYQHSMLQDVPPQVFAYERTLEELYLDSNRICDLPRPLFHCHGLRVLSMSDNDIQNLPPAIASLINLQHLDLSRNELCGIPDNIKGCKHLTYVDVSVNQLEKLPEGFTQLLSLEELYLNDTCLDFLPANFGRLTKLRILELRENNLNTLPKSIARLTNLERMDIGQNEFSDLPEVIGRLTNLTELWIDCNRVRSIPKFIGNLKKLMHFDASTNNINWIASEIGLCVGLLDVTLSCNQIQEVPVSIGNLKQLVTLKLDENQLTSLPNTIGRLSNLEELILSQNDFETLPPCIGLLRKLNILNVDENMLEELPPEVGSCTSLAILSIHSNKLQELPAELGHLPKIRVINVSDNRLQNLPVSILNLTFLTALWLSNNQSTPLTMLQQEVDKVTGQTVCINFMLPQSAQELYLAENRYDMEIDVQCKSRQLEKSSIKRPHIRFATDAESEMTGHLVRAPTPYPKELRAMAKHARSYQQQHTRRTSRENDGEFSMLGEIVSPGPKGVLIKEAKVKKPNTVPLSQSSGSKKDKDNEENTPVQSIDNTISVLKSVIENCGDNSTILASGSGPVIKEAKCIRQVIGSSEEHDNVSCQKEDAIPISQPIGDYISPPIAEIVTSPVELNKLPNDFSRSSLSSEQPQQKPPPYHIAAAYSKQAAYFQTAGSPSSYKADSSLDSLKLQHLCIDISSNKVETPAKTSITKSSEQKHADYEEHVTGTPQATMQSSSFTETISFGDLVRDNKTADDISEKNEDSFSEKETLIEIDHIKKIDSPEIQINEIDEPDAAFFYNNEDDKYIEEAEENTTAFNKCPDSSIEKSKVLNNRKLSHECLNDLDLTQSICTIKTTISESTTNSPILTNISPATSQVVSSTFTKASTPNNIGAETASTIDFTDSEIDIGKPNTQIPDIISNSIVKSSSNLQKFSQDYIRNSYTSSKCRIPVRHEEVSSETLPHGMDDLLNKPSTFIQDKPALGNSILAPTPQRPGYNSPTSPYPTSPTLVSMTKSPSLKLGSKIPYLLPTIAHAVGKSDSKFLSESESQSSKPEKVAISDENYISPSVLTNQIKSELSLKSTSSGNWSSPSDRDTFSDSLTATRIPQPGFCFSSPLSYHSSKRGSLSSQSSGNSQPGSITPLKSNFLDSSILPTNKEAGYSYLKKPRESTTDNNLNIPSKIPTATSPSLSLPHLNQDINYSNNAECKSSHTNSKYVFSNEQGLLVSKIPTLSSIPTSPISDDTDNSSNKTNPGNLVKQKTWMFGPHRNATVFPVVIKKNPGLGFSITGGLGVCSPLEKKDSKGIYVTKVQPNGPANSFLQPGDKILQVDGTDFTKLEHDQAVSILRLTGNIVNMMISRQV